MREKGKERKVFVFLKKMRSASGNAASILDRGGKNEKKHLSFPFLYPLPLHSGSRGEGNQISEIQKKTRHDRKWSDGVKLSQTPHTPNHLGMSKKCARPDLK